MSGHSALGDAANRFLASMTITFDMWHDGEGYDLRALAEISPSERAAIEDILIRHQPRDWRDIEALAAFDSARARDAIVAALEHPDPQVRHEAMRYAGGKADPVKREARLIDALRSAAPCFARCAPPSASILRNTLDPANQPAEAQWLQRR